MHVGILPNYWKYYSSTRTNMFEINPPTTLYAMVALEGLTQDLNIDGNFMENFTTFPQVAKFQCLRIHPFAKLDVKFYVYDFTRWPRRDTKDLNIDVKFHGKTFTTFPQVFHVCDFSPVAKFYVNFMSASFHRSRNFTSNFTSATFPRSRNLTSNFMSATFPRSQNLPWIFFQ